jgi:hypothetical protein
LEVTKILAIYAACLSTVVFIWNIVRTIPRYKVDIIFGTTEIEGEFKDGVYVSIKNPSPHTVHLSNVSLLYPHKKVNLIELVKFALKYRRFSRAVGWVHTSLSNYKVDDKCPTALESGRSHNVFVPHDVLEEILKDCESRQIKAVVQDQLWRNKYSGRFEYPEYKIESS